MPPAQPELNATFTVDPEVTFQQLGEETVLVHLVTDKIHHTNATGTRIWALLQDKLSLGEILDRLEREFDAGREQLAGDLNEFVVRLLDERMIRRV